MKDINVLILSAGTRNKVVQAFRQVLAGRGHVIATDASSLAPAIYDADRAYLVPRITDPHYLDRILEICRKEQITGVFSLIDPELSLLAQNRERFTAMGVTPIVSDYRLCELSLHKYAMFVHLRQQQIPTAQCWMTLDDFLQQGEPAFPVFVKPEDGSASLHITQVDSMEMLLALKDAEPGLMIQELMKGQEYGADVYVDLVSGKTVSVFLKKKIRMRAGETDKSISVKDPEILHRIAAFAEQMGYRGMIDLDLFHEEEKAEDGVIHHPEGTWYLSEVNPRFGGGYPHAFAAGVNFPAYVVNNLSGKANEPDIGGYETGICMMKYNETAIVRGQDLIR